MPALSPLPSMAQTSQAAPYVNGDASWNYENFLIRISDEQELSRIRCRWRVSETSLTRDVPQYFQTVDLLLKTFPTVVDGGIEGTEIHTREATGTSLELLARQACDSRQGLESGTEVAAVVILASKNGYLCRSDIVEKRMFLSIFVDRVVSFGSWNRRLTAFSASEQGSLLSLLVYSPAAIITKQVAFCRDQSWRALLKRDLNMRLSFDWIVPNKPASYTVALVAGRHMNDEQRVVYRAQGFLEAAHSLGIAITVIDAPGHWLEDEKYAHLRDDFIAMDLSLTPDLPHRIVERVRDRCFDGIVTFTDDYVIAIAEVAEMLCLPTEPARAVWRAHHKNEMRSVVENDGVQTLYLDNVEQLEAPGMLEKLGAMRYPLIVKPSYGCNSAGVQKVANNADMREAVYLLGREGLADEGIMLETFVDGPEVDCNFVLCNGKVSFLEVADDLPSAGDATNATPSDNFFETAMISNSALPSREVNILRSSLHKNLLRLGLGWGVYHVEGRMMNSSMQYKDAHGNGTMDLVTKDNSTNHRPSAFLIEANVRPSGIAGSQATMSTYGVDFDGLHLLRAVGDRERFEALSKPFLFPDDAGGGGGAQFWAARGLIPVHREGILVPDNFFQRVFEKVPDVAPFTYRAEVDKKPGTVVSPRGGVGLLAHFLLYSRVSRRHVVDMYYRVAAAAKEVLDR
ncbi:ATP-grasp fold [Fusarium austroafricanum]|uniref:ATP-grasp fold n=1 Tax=Fusarium austroafricanum TaxID=2364996 RepID=A0A8H4NHK5_9HYPO|nr:ATP-grasp fold [Fusarium austroafricanum]